MKKRIVRSCMILMLGLAVTQTIVPAEESEDTPGIEGVWFAKITSIDCTSHVPLPNAVPFRGLYMFSHDGSLTNEAAFLVPGSPPRSSGLGVWRHAQGRTYTATFRFFRYNPDNPDPRDNSFQVMRKVSFTIVLNGDQFTSLDQFQEYDKDNQPLPPGGPTPTSGCGTETATRVQ